MPHRRQPDLDKALLREQSRDLQTLHEENAGLKSARRHDHERLGLLTATLLVVASLGAVVLLHDCQARDELAQLRAAPPAQDVAEDTGLEPSWMADAGALEQPTGLERPKPLGGQKRAPCTPGLEVEVSGACWLDVNATRPCPPKRTVEWEGRCLMPVRAPPPPTPTSAQEMRP